jgi:hypothetical protein
LNLLAYPSPLVSLLFKVAVQWAFFAGPVLSVPLLALFRRRSDGGTRFALVTVGLTLAAVLLTSGAWPHYLAPVAPLAFALSVQGSRLLTAWRGRGGRSGRYWVPSLLLLWPLQLLLMVWIFPSAMEGLRWRESRSDFAAELERLEGEDLVLVRYGPHHTWYKEWVYNGADIDGAEVVWARELSPQQNRRLLQYFHIRRVWLVEPDRVPPALVPYDIERLASARD